MADVGIRQLKEHLSEYRDRAEGGEVVRVTERGRPKAVLGPVPGRAQIDAGIRDGWITGGSGQGLRPIRRCKGSRPGRGCAERGSRRVTLYLDSSALLKRYVDEADSEAGGHDPSLRPSLLPRPRSLRMTVLGA
jgi:prevent-host-death family protein